MKTIIKKFWGVAFVLVLLSTLLIGAIPQASAGVLNFTWATLPGGLTGGVAFNPQAITAPGMVIYDFAVAADGMTIYAATNQGAWKSFNGGRSWIPLLTTGLPAVRYVAVAPDDANLVAYLDVFGNNVSISADGGITFATAGQARNSVGAVAANVTDIAIAKQAVVEGTMVHIIAVTGDNGTHPALYYINYGAAIAGWRNAMEETPFVTVLKPAQATGEPLNYSVGGGEVNFKAIAFSPNFDLDFVCYLVGDDGGGAGRVGFHVVSFNSQEWDSGIPGFPLYVFGNMVIANLGAGLGCVKAQIIHDPNFIGGDESLRITYVSLASNANTGGVYRITDNAIPVVFNIGLGSGVVAAVWSIGLSSDGSSLVAAAAQSSTTWTAVGPNAPNPLFITFVPSRVIKRSGGGAIVGISTATDNMTIAYANADVLLARGSTSGAFSRSIDNGFTFNDISLVNTLLTVIRDQAIAPDGIQRYVISDDNVAQTSVFYFDGTYWERTLTLNNLNGYIAKPSPNNFSILYLGNRATATIFYTITAGTVNWLQRTSPVPASVLVDLEVQDDATLYVATTVGGVGYVTRLSNSGLIWPVGPPYYNAVFPGGNVASLTLVGTDKVIAGSTAGLVSYTTTGGAAWIPILIPVGAAGAVFATATDLTAGSMIYATTAVDVSVFVWIIGTSTTWGTPWYTETSATNLAVDLEIYDGCLYYIGTNGTPDTVIARALLPALPGTWAQVNIGAQIIFGPSFPATATAAVMPDVLKFSQDGAGGDNVVWFIDATGVGGIDQIITYQDTLAYSTPTLLSPDDNVVIPVNRETGIAYNTTLSWAAASFATQYNVQIAYDAAFTNLFANVNVVAAFPWGSITNTVIGPGAGAAIVINYQPGETYYWRVRASLPFFSPWSAVYTLNVMPIPSPIPILYQPDTSSIVDNLRPGFSWSPMSVSDVYTFELATDPDFVNMVYTVDTTSTGVQLTADLVDGTQYFWRVKVLSSIDDGWSTVGNFRVDLSVVQPPVTVTENPVPTINLTQSADEVINPSYIWAIIIIGAVLVIAVIVLIVRTRQS